MRIWDGHTGLALTEPFASEGRRPSPELSPDCRRLLVKVNETDNPAIRKLRFWEIRLGISEKRILTAEFRHDLQQCSLCPFADSPMAD